MLDDCKGEKFDELVAVFSTAVLRRVLSVSASDTPSNPALKLATSPAISPTDYQNLLPLVLAHRVSLGSSGGRQAQLHETCEQFSQFLDNKNDELSQRASLQKSKGATDYSKVDTAGITRELQANWLGNEEWALALLNGGSHSNTDSILELSFAQTWNCAKKSSLNDLGGRNNSDLVADLETRVLRLRRRLRHWHEYNDSLQNERQSNSNMVGTKPAEPRVQFRDHKAMTVASISKAVRQPADRERSLKEADRSFILTVKEAIEDINSKLEVRLPSPIEPLITQSSPPPISPEEPSYQSMTPSPLENAQITDPLPTISPPDTQRSYFHQENSYSSPPIVRLSPDHLSAEQVDLDQEPEPEPLKQQPPQNYTLAERTRKSMSLIPPLPSHENPRPQRRGPRPSFPINQFETPRKTSQPGSIRSGASTPQDQLFEEDADYASVFKSRPRVALSPVSSPTVDMSISFDEDEEFELGYDDTELEAVDSPLAVQRTRRM